MRAARATKVMTLAVMMRIIFPPPMMESPRKEKKGSLAGASGFFLVSLPISALRPPKWAPAGFCASEPAVPTAPVDADEPAASTDPAAAITPDPAVSPAGASTSWSPGFSCTSA